MMGAARTALATAMMPMSVRPQGGSGGAGLALVWALLACRLRRRLSLLRRLRRNHLPWRRCLRQPSPMPALSRQPHPLRLRLPRKWHCRQRARHQPLRLQTTTRRPMQVSLQGTQQPNACLMLRVVPRGVDFGSLQSTTLDLTEAIKLGALGTGRISRQIANRRLRSWAPGSRTDTTASAA